MHASAKRPHWNIEGELDPRLQLVVGRGDSRATPLRLSGSSCTFTHRPAGDWVLSFSCPAFSCPALHTPPSRVQACAPSMECTALYPLCVAHPTAPQPHAASLTPPLVLLPHPLRLLPPLEEVEVLVDSSVEIRGILPLPARQQQCRLGMGCIIACGPLYASLAAPRLGTSYPHRPSSAPAWPPSIPHAHTFPMHSCITHLKPSPMNACRPLPRSTILNHSTPSSNSV